MFSGFHHFIGSTLAEGLVERAGPELPMGGIFRDAATYCRVGVVQSKSAPISNLLELGLMAILVLVVLPLRNLSANALILVC